MTENFFIFQVTDKFVWKVGLVVKIFFSFLQKANLNSYYGILSAINDDKLAKLVDIISKFDVFVVIW